MSLIHEQRGIIEIMGEVVKATSADCVLRYPDFRGSSREIDCPTINYIFGNAQYIKDELDKLSQTPRGNEIKFPLIALFCPFTENRSSPHYHSKAEVNLLIACSSMQSWSNEQRLEFSFQGILRPIYAAFMESIKADDRFETTYPGIIPHKYSENYTYGKYGAYTGSGESISEPIDAITITNLELILTKQTCR